MASWCDVFALMSISPANLPAGPISVEGISTADAEDKLQPNPGVTDS
jgi:hypothetical protein